MNISFGSHSHDKTSSQINFLRSSPAIIVELILHHTSNEDRSSLVFIELFGTDITKLIILTLISATTTHAATNTKFFLDSAEFRSFQFNTSNIYFTALNITIVIDKTIVILSKNLAILTIKGALALISIALTFQSPPNSVHLFSSTFLY